MNAIHVYKKKLYKNNYSKYSIHFLHILIKPFLYQLTKLAGKAIFRNNGNAQVSNLHFFSATVSINESKRSQNNKLCTFQL